jgi:hypothetical protein
MRSNFTYLSIFVLCTFFLTPVFGYEEEDAPLASQSYELLWQLQQSRWEINEELGLGYSSTTGSIVELFPSIQFFILKNLSVGGSFEIIKSGENKFLGIGPSATYYFYERGRWATYVGQRVSYRFITPDSWPEAQKLTASTYLGFNYFTSTKMALGGLFATNYKLNGVSEANRTSARFVVSFYY